ncbi:hypothetical protein Msil_1751 [Methylocella silvestris BL2]|uniref:Uncharacterized protein n=1 Tax=Methylocella silvestris (strain DSM 15510 / CIP 108128 / LMG 27833 / NCIMB 13906 / BL2) TaxID=395965 RepID=B8ELR6_METSB|nr:hypothetical protein [Methylocella silvestris]ACK50697.1 hypothetical protein Msil_1751 [Methylocella silvestris BL2]
MSYARFYQHGVKAYVEGRALSMNPHNPRDQAEACEGWTEGWLDARQAHVHRLANELSKTLRPIQIDRFIAAREYSFAV